jgi:hypothetical protein
MKAYAVRFTARVMLVIMVCQLVLPATQSHALTTGPSQPEVQSFEPVGTTEMVDLFSGDFVYNIPLLDVEGYPVNISYHSGINMEQEASWVGLGWNINPGEINRNVRGVPDDFNGDTLYKKLNINEETDWRFKVGATFGTELFGFANVGITGGISISTNNYKGMGVTLDLDANAGLSIPYFSPQIGMGVSAGSQEGASVDASASLNFASNRSVNESGGSISLSGSTGFNTRTGLKNIGLGWSVKLSNPEAQGGTSGGTSIPIGLQNYVSVITNASTQNAFSLQVKLGPEIFGGFPTMNATLAYSKLKYLPDGSRRSYGFLYAQNANDSAIMDFSREKDGMYNNTLPNLPLSSMTYDVYSITAQGTGGMFRPFRNDIGSVFDPSTGSSSSNTSANFEAGLGGAYEFGADVSTYDVKVKSGPWFRRSFIQNNANSLFENAYFKQAGEMTYSLSGDNAIVSNHNPVAVGPTNRFMAKGGADLGGVAAKYGGTNNRSSRASFLSFLTNEESTIKDIGTLSKIESFNNNEFTSPYSGGVLSNKYDRSGTKANKAKKYQIGEMTQVLPDGRRYVYAIPAMNNFQKEVTFAVNNAYKDINSGLVGFNRDGGQDDAFGNTQGLDNYYQATYTPAYAHSYLLTSVLSPDYMDITGDGLSEDDLGSYTKINYTRTDADYRWITPYQAAKSEYGVGADIYNAAQYNPGFWSDPKDDKGNYVVGSKEMWYMHSIESKNMIAEFYSSPRPDGMGVKKSIVNGGDIASDRFDPFLALPKTTGNSVSYKLDSIKLYSKHDRILNATAAIPIKTVYFTYDWTLCLGVPNNSAGTGKLTLKRIFFKYGNSDKSLVNPYEFNYSPVNKPYNFAEKDRWGNYKQLDPQLTNYEFPYVKQNKTEADANASTWHLTSIKLPSGGNLNIQYEADDYSFVQDKRTMEMFRIAGVGSSSMFVPKDILYEDLSKPYQYIYFERDIAREIPGKSLKETYLQDEDLLYFSFNVDMAGTNTFENIKGYAQIDNNDIGICGGNNPGNKYLFIKVKLESAGLKSEEKINPVTLAALNTGRYYLPHIMYKGYSGSGAMDILKGLMAAGGELLSITKNANKRFVEQSKAKKITVGKSWIRLNTPGYTKLGGGTRVKQLKISDEWDKMASNGSAAEYGQKYDYTTLLDNKYRISSGVASYEPLIGADEIPQHRPANKYTADGGRLMPAIEFNQEAPFGESFYPGASVGYSKVTVTSIHQGPVSAGGDGSYARSAKSKNVQEFYTAKDFPIETEFTEKSVPVNTKEYGLSSRFEEVNVLQGYVLRMNDMHGKPKASSNYVIKQSGPGAPEFNELVTSTKYNYQTQNGKLYNKVKTVKRSALVRPTYSVTDMVLGEEVDLTIDNRMRDMDSKSMNISANLNAIGFGIFIIPIPTLFLPDTYEKSVFKTMVSTKIIQQYGILKSVETVDHGARVVSENILYDSETGHVLLTTTNNEFNDPISSASLPAYWAYDNMGASYYNTGYEEIVDSVRIDHEGKGYLIGVDDKRYFNLGDELLMRTTENGVSTEYRVWVTGMQVPPYGPLPPHPANPCGTPPPPSTYLAGMQSYEVVPTQRCDGTKWWHHNSGNNTLWYQNGTTWVYYGTAQDPPNFCPQPQPAAPAPYTSVCSGGYEWIYSADINGIIYRYWWNGTSWIGPYGSIWEPLTTPPSNGCTADFVPVIEPRAKVPVNSTGTNTPWTTYSKGYKKVYVKVLRSGRRNQLNSSVQSLSIKGAFDPNQFVTSLLSGVTAPANVLAATANTFTEDALTDEFTNAAGNGFNKYVLGEKGNFREFESFSFLTPRNNASNHNRNNGLFNVYYNFWLGATNNEPCSLNDIIMQVSGGMGWKTVKKVSQYSAYGLPLEEVDAAGIYSTALYGYNHSLPIAVGTNISNRRIKYFNFEDLLKLNADNDRILGIPEILKPNGGYTYKKYHGLTYISYLPAFGTAYNVSTEQAHTGNYALKFTGSGSIKLGNVHDFETTGNNRYCYVSMWVRPVSGSISTSGMNLQGFGTAANPNAAQNFTAFSVKTSSIDGWYKVEGKIDMGPLNAYDAINLVMPANYYVDDIRMYPDKGNMKSFAYNMSNLRLMAELDENNFATFYEYDQEGVLVRVKKESDRGILTVSENRKSNAKKIQ